MGVLYEWNSFVKLIHETDKGREKGKYQDYLAEMGLCRETGHCNKQKNWFKLDSIDLQLQKEDKGKRRAILFNTKYASLIKYQND